MTNDDTKNEQSETPSVPLKGSGEMMNIDSIQSWTDILRCLLEELPVEFQALRALVEGRNHEVCRDMIEILRDREGLLDENCLPYSGIILIIKSGYRETMDGPCLVDPIEFRTNEEFDNYQERLDLRELRVREGMKRFVKNVFDDSVSGSEQSR